MDPAQPTTPSGRLVTLTLELANTRTNRTDRLRNRTESYILGVAHGTDATGFRPAFDPFSFCCYRAMLLGAPGAVIGATLKPGKRNLLTEPLSPQCLAGEEVVERREWSNRIALFFRMHTDGGETGERRFFGCRASDTTRDPSAAWLRYYPAEVVLDRATGLPPTFADPADFAAKAATLGRGKPTKAQMWNTWFWLLLHATFCASKRPAAAVGAKLPLILPWRRNEFGIRFQRHSVVKKGR